MCRENSVFTSAEGTKFKACSPCAKGNYQVGERDVEDVLAPIREFLLNANSLDEFWGFFFLDSCVNIFYRLDPI